MICVHNVPYALLHIRYIFKQQIRRLPDFSQAGQFKEESAAWISESFSRSCNAESLVILNFGITRLSALQDPGKDSEIREEPSSLNWPDWLKPGSLRICFLRTWWVSSIMTTAGHLRQSSTRWTDWGMVWNGNVLTAKISASPSQETACTLSDILMSDVEEKYFLSPKQQEVLLFKPTVATKGSASTPPKD